MSGQHHRGRGRRRSIHFCPCRRHSNPWTPARGGRFDEHKGSLIP